MCKKIYLILCLWVLSSMFCGCGKNSLVKQGILNNKDILPEKESVFPIKDSTDVRSETIATVESSTENVYNIEEETTNHEPNILQDTNEKLDAINQESSVSSIETTESISSDKGMDISTVLEEESQGEKSEVEVLVSSETENDEKESTNITDEINSEASASLTETTESTSIDTHTDIATLGDDETTEKKDITTDEVDYNDKGIILPDDDWE